MSAGARSEFLRFAAEAEDIACVEVLVREDRSLSLAIAERTGVAHQSPQAILLGWGQPRWHGSHQAVTCDALRAACRASASKGGA